MNTLYNDPESPWDLLQEPALPSGSIDSRFRLLLSALDQGWEVIEPVYFRPRWKDGDAWVFHFILKKIDTGQNQLITVRQCQEVELIIRREGWKLDYDSTSRFPPSMNSL